MIPGPVAFIRYFSSSDIDDRDDVLGRLDDFVADDKDSAVIPGRRQFLFLGGASAGALLPGLFSIHIDSLNASADENSVIQKPYPDSFLLQSNADGTIASKVSIPLIAYSFYKTSSEFAPRGLALALRGGVRHYDMATDYGNSDIIAPLFQKYFKKGKIDWDFEEEKDELLQKLDLVRQKADSAYKNETKTKSFRGTEGQGRNNLFLTYKLSNAEQSTDPAAVRQTIRKLTSKFGTSYLDLVSLHSPLTGSSRRLATYKALLQMKEEGYIRSVGVCNYGVCHLKEIVENGMPLPSMNQLELSPFNTHGPIVQFCKQNNVLIGCAAWSRLSSADGPVEQWEKLGQLAKAKGVTKAQILVRWALQKGYACAPRSGTKSKLERIAIAENSYGGVVDFLLSGEEMNLLDNLNVDYKSGKLGRKDGWKEEDVKGSDWEPSAC